MPLEVFIGPIGGFVFFYFVGWTMRNDVHGMNGPKDYARFSLQAMGVLFIVGFVFWAVR